MTSPGRHTGPVSGDASSRPGADQFGISTPEHASKAGKQLLA